MSSGLIRQFLERFVASERATALGIAIASGLGGLVVMGLTFGIAYGAAWFFLVSFFTGATGWALWIAIALLIALFVGNLTTSREYLETFSFTTGTASDVIVSVPVLDHHASTINPLAPDSAHSMLKMIVGLLFTGPRLIMAAFRGLQRRRRLENLDVDGCAALLSLLVEKGQRVSLTAVAAALPERPIPLLLPQLALMNGVLFLKSGEPGLSLSTDLRREIGEWRNPA